MSEALEGHLTLSETVAAHPEHTAELTELWPLIKDGRMRRAERAAKQFAVEMFGFLVGQ